jgi:hypothetical protein
MDGMRTRSFVGAFWAYDSAKQVYPFMHRTETKPLGKKN